MPSLPQNTEDKYSKTAEDKPRRKSFGKTDFIEDIVPIKITRPRRGSLGKSGEHTTIQSKDSPPIAFKRKESIGKLAVRSFDYNDPDLVFQMSPTGPVVMGGTKQKLISLLTDISVIGSYL